MLTMQHICLPGAWCSRNYHDKEFKEQTLVVKQGKEASLGLKTEALLEFKIKQHVLHETMASLSVCRACA